MRTRGGRKRSDKLTIRMADFDKTRSEGSQPNKNSGNPRMYFMMASGKARCFTRPGSHKK